MPNPNPNLNASLNPNPNPNPNLNPNPNPSRFQAGNEASETTLDLGNKKIAIVMSSQAVEGAKRPMIEVRARVEP